MKTYEIKLGLNQSGEAILVTMKALWYNVDSEGRLDLMGDVDEDGNEEWLATFKEWAYIRQVENEA